MTLKSLNCGTNHEAMRTLDKIYTDEPGAKFGRVWNQARQYSKTKDEIRSIIERHQRNQLKVRRIGIIALAASLFLTVGVITFFKPLSVWISQPKMVKEDRAEQVRGVTLFPSRSPERKALLDTFQVGYGTVLKWYPDSTLQYKSDLQFKIHGWTR